MVNGALNCNGGCACSKGVQSWRKAVTRKLWLLLLMGGDPVGQLVLCEKDFGLTSSANGLFDLAGGTGTGGNHFS
jgi:hypothetical protein